MARFGDCAIGKNRLSTLQTGGSPPYYPWAACMSSDANLQILMYSHDTFGLGHLRRCRTIAHAMVDRFPGLNIAIISGSPVVDAFSFHERVSFVQIPAAKKLPNGAYTSGNGQQTLEDTIAAREAVIREAAERLRPDMLIVDKEPLGLGREMLATLEWLKAEGCICVLGLRDVLDAPELLREEWHRKNIIPQLDHLYDQIWIYGPDSFFNPLDGLDIPPVILDRVRYTGFLPRSLPDVDDGTSARYGENYVLVTAGGGGDGFELMSAALEAIEHIPENNEDFLFVLGPFMTDEQRNEITVRAAHLPRTQIVDFHANVETLIANAKAIVGMCGYNTFCEVLSFDKRALFVPRTEPRQEQSIRAHRASEFGWTNVMDMELAKDPDTFFDAINAVLGRDKPSSEPLQPDLGGLEKICQYSAELFEDRASGGLPEPDRAPTAASS